jgi:hypothetical protein
MRLPIMSRNNSIDATALDLRRMLQDCPACEANLNNHAYARFAVTVTSPERKLQNLEFFQSLKDHDWQKAQSFQDFDSYRNAAEAIVLRCSNSSLVMLMVRNPAEYLESSRLLDFEVLDAESRQKLEPVINVNKWRKL